MAQNVLRRPLMRRELLSPAILEATVGIVIPLVSVSASTAATVEIADDDTSSAIAIRDVTRRGNVIVGTLTNRGADQIRDIRLLIDIPFLWANEVKPGEDSPGRATVLTVKGPLPPHGELAFEFTPNPPLPERTDGRFGDPQVRVMGFSSVAAR